MIGWILLLALAAFIAVLLVRAALMKPPVTNVLASKPVAIDADKAVDLLAKMVRVQTISSADESLVDDDAFVKFRALLAELFPLVHKNCAPMLCKNAKNGRESGLLFCWKGKSSAAPSVLMAHYDVVPVDASVWTHPPFCGEVFDGFLWGRGTLDTKITMMGILHSAEMLMNDGFVPKNDIYFAFGGDEEVSGHGALDIIAELKRRGVKPAMVVDEGGAVVSGVFPGVKKPIAVVGIGEKGRMNVELKIRSGGGHASQPITPSALGKMGKAIVACESHAFSAHLTKPVRELFTTVGAHAPFGLRIIFANLWCFGSILCLAANKLGGDINAMMRTTVAFTMAKASPQINVIPNEVTAGVNLRLINLDTPQSAMNYLKKCVDNNDVQFELGAFMPASPYASTDGEHWKLLASAIGQTWGEAIVSPYLMFACSDSSNYAGYCDDVYRFSAMELSNEQRGLIHNIDERIPTEDVAKTVEFFTRLEQLL